MTELSGLEHLVAEHPNQVFELTATRGANGDSDYAAAVTIFESQQPALRGGMVGTGHGTAPTIGEAIALAVTNWTPTNGGE